MHTIYIIPCAFFFPSILSLLPYRLRLFCCIAVEQHWCAYLQCSAYMACLLRLQFWPTCVCVCEPNGMRYDGWAVNVWYAGHRQWNRIRTAEERRGKKERCVLSSSSSSKKKRCRNCKCYCRWRCSKCNLMLLCSGHIAECIIKTYHNRSGRWQGTMINSFYSRFERNFFFCQNWTWFALYIPNMSSNKLPSTLLVPLCCCRSESKWCTTNELSDKTQQFLSRYDIADWHWHVFAVNKAKRSNNCFNRFRIAISRYITLYSHWTSFYEHAVCQANGCLLPKFCITFTVN